MKNIIKSLILFITVILILNPVQAYPENKEPYIRIAVAGDPHLPVGITERSK